MTDHGVARPSATDADDPSAAGTAPAGSGSGETDAAAPSDEPVTDSGVPDDGPRDVTDGEPADESGEGPGGGPGETSDDAAAVDEPSADPAGPADRTDQAGPAVPAARRRRSRSLRRPDGSAVPARAEPPTTRLAAAPVEAPDPRDDDGLDPDVDPDAPTVLLPTSPAARRRRRRRALVLAAAALALVVALGALVLPGDEPDPATGSGPPPPLAEGVGPADPAPSVPTDCAPVTLLSADGDTRSPLRGPIREAERLRPRLVPLEVPRPADGAAWPRAVRSSLEATAAQCPTTTFLVYAWSDGAAATTEALSAMEAEASPTVGRVAGVALVGNPARDPARRTLPASTRGTGVQPSPAGSLRALGAGTVELCAPADPVCAAPAPGGAPARASALRSPAHRDYSRVGTGVADRTVPAWLTDAARQAVDAVAPVAAPPGQPAPPRALTGGLFAPAPAAGPVGGALTALGLPVRNPRGLIWRAASGGRLGFGTFKRNAFDEQSGTPALVPGVRGGPAIRFSVPPGGQRSEMQPNKTDPREGQTQFVGYYGVLAPDFPIDNPDFQILLQWHHPGPDGSPPLTVEASHGELRLTGGDRRPFVASIGSIRPGQAVNLQLQVTFSADPSRGAVSVWRDGQMVINSARPPEGTLYAGDDSAYMKLGMYRRESAAGRATVYVNDVLVGTTLASVSPVARGPG